MRRLIPILLGAALVVLAFSAAPASAHYRNCGKASRYLRHVTALHVSCRTARRVARHSGRGWNCSSSPVSGNPFGGTDTTRVSCSSGRRRVKWYAVHTD